MEEENSQTKNHFDAFDWLRKHTIITCIILLIILIVIPVSFYVPSAIGFIPREEAGNVLGYYGSIIGGSLTLLGVWWTINDQENKRREDLAIQYRPLLVIESKNITNPYLDGNNIQTLLNTLKLRNIGRAEAINITIHAPFNYPFIQTTIYQYLSKITKLTML